MNFRPLDIPGAYLLEPERTEERHGFFTRTYCRDELENQGLDPTLVRCEVSVNERRGTVQGIHYQGAPYEAIRLVRCTVGMVYVVIVDLRHESPAYLRHIGVELCPAKRRSLYIPAGAGHGFQTLEDGTEVFFQTSEFHYPECEQGVRWDDPELAIEWPQEITEISDRDQSFPDLTVRSLAS